MKYNCECKEGASDMCKYCHLAPEKKEKSKCCERCKCNNLTSDHQYIMGIHSCDNSKCECHKSPLPEEKDLVDWESEFDKVWSTSEITNLKERLKNLVYKKISEYLESTVSSNTERVKRDLIKEINRLKKETKFLDNGTMSVVGSWANPVYNQALEDIINKLK